MSKELECHLAEIKEIIMETLLVLIMLVMVLDITALRWGFDSTEKIDSPEWERRATWYADLASPGPGGRKQML